MIRSKQIKEIHSFNQSTGLCILINHNNGIIKVGLKQCEETLVKRVLEHYTANINDSEESKIVVKKWWQFWKND